MNRFYDHELFTLKLQVNNYRAIEKDQNVKMYKNIDLFFLTVVNTCEAPVTRCHREAEIASVTGASCLQEYVNKEFVSEF